MPASASYGTCCPTSGVLGTNCYSAFLLASHLCPSESALHQHRKALLQLLQADNAPQTEQLQEEQNAMVCMNYNSSLYISCIYTATCLLGTCLDSRKGYIRLQGDYSCGEGR